MLITTPLIHVIYLRLAVPSPPSHSQSLSEREVPLFKEQKSLHPQAVDKDFMFLPAGPCLSLFCSGICTFSHLACNV